MTNLPATQAEAAELSREDTVDVLLEGPDEEGHALTGATAYDQATTDQLVESMKHMSILLRRLVRSFLSAEIEGEPAFQSIADYDWEPLRA